MKSFLIGAVGYPLLELAWRGRTHPSMSLAGALSAALIHQVNRTSKSYLCKILLCGCGVTLIEAIVGLACNRKHQVWDYSRMPMNWRGQICLPFTLAWCGLSAVYMAAENLIIRHRRR